MQLRDIFEFSSPEKQRELEKIYGPTISSWSDVKSWDDVIIKEKKALVSELEEENRGKERCPYLKKLENYFYFCEARAKQLEKIGMRLTDKPEIFSCQYSSQTDHFSMQLWCMQPEEIYGRCINFVDSKQKQLVKSEKQKSSKPSAESTFRDEYGIERIVEPFDMTNHHGNVPN